MKPNVAVINPKDNVAITLVDVAEGEKICLPDGQILTALCDVPFSHKVSLRNIDAGEEIIKYGEIIGRAKDNIQCGDWVHTHNLAVDE